MLLFQANAIVAKVGYATYIKKPEELNKRFVKVRQYSFLSLAFKLIFEGEMDQSVREPTTIIIAS